VALDRKQRRYLNRVRNRSPALVALDCCGPTTIASSKAAVSGTRPELASYQTTTEIISMSNQNQNDPAQQNQDPNQKPGRQQDGGKKPGQQQQDRIDPNNRQGNQNTEYSGGT
jgi:hypothetical protein